MFYGDMKRWLQLSSPSVTMSQISKYRGPKERTSWKSETNADVSESERQ